MPSPVMFDDRSRRDQVVIAGVVPALVGALAGGLIGVSGAAYWVVAGLAAVGAFAAGSEHHDGWEAADRGLVGGVIYASALLLVHALLGVPAKVSLGSFPPLLVVVSAIIGMLLGAAGGRIARFRRAGRTLSGDDAG